MRSFWTSLYACGPGAREIAFGRSDFAVGRSCRISSWTPRFRARSGDGCHCSSPASGSPGWWVTGSRTSSAGGANGAACVAEVRFSEERHGLPAGSDAAVGR